MSCCFKEIELVHFCAHARPIRKARVILLGLKHLFSASYRNINGRRTYARFSPLHTIQLTQTLGAIHKGRPHRGGGRGLAKADVGGGGI